MNNKMLLDCINVDIENIKENGFNTIQEILNFYKNKNYLEILLIFIEYYGIENLKEVDENE